MVASRFPEARLIALAENRGFAAAVNAGVAATEAPFLFVLNADTAVETDPLPSLRQAMEAHPRWAVAGPALAHPDGRPQESRTPFPRVQDALAAFLRGGTGAAGGGGAVGGGGAAALAPDALAPAAGDAAPGWYLMGAALLFRREALDAVGPLDESYFFYLDEVDWFLRAAAA